MRERLGALAAFCPGGRSAHLPAVEAGPTPEQLAEVRRLRLENSHHDPTPTPLERQVHGLGARLLDLAIRAGVINNDSETVQGRLYRIKVWHQRSTDGLAERIATAQIETRSHQVVATGAALEIGTKRVAPQTLEQFKDDLPELALSLSRQAAENFIADFQPPKGTLRRVMVSARGVAQSMVENNQSRILAVASLVFAMATPAAVMLGAPLAAQVGAAGISVMFARGARGASAEDMARNRSATEVRRQLDPRARDTAIHELEAWGRGMLKARELMGKPTLVLLNPTPVSAPLAATPAVAGVNLVA